MKRPRAPTASAAASTTARAAASASAAASSKMTISGFGSTTLMIPRRLAGACSSETFVEAALALEGRAIPRVVRAVRLDRLPGRRRGGAQVGDAAERLEREQRGAAARGFLLAREHERLAQRVGDRACPRARARDRAAGSDDRMS